MSAGGGAQRHRATGGAATARTIAGTRIMANGSMGSGSNVSAVASTTARADERGSLDIRAG